MQKQYLVLAGVLFLAGCGSNGTGGGGGSTPGDASTDSAGQGNDASMDAGTQGSMDSGKDTGGPSGDASMSDGGKPGDAGGNPGDAGGNPGDAGDGGSPSTDGGDSGAAASCIKGLFGDYVITSAGHVFATQGSPSSASWTAITAGGNDLDQVVSGAQSSEFGCALRSDGTVWCWSAETAAQAGGNTYYGQMGDGTTAWPAQAYVATQVQVSAGTSLTNIASLTTSGENVYGRPLCAVDTSGHVWCWGATGPDGGGSTLLINTAPSTSYAQPYAIQIAKSGAAGDLLTGVSLVSAGGNQVCVVLAASGQVECWGSNIYGGLGTATADGGSPNSSNYPVPIVGLPTSPAPSQIWAGYDNTCVLIGGEVYCWGSSQGGDTGTGITPGFNCAGIYHYCDPPGSPVVLAEPDGGVGGPLTGVTDLYFGYSFGCAIVGSGNLDCWGAGPSGTVLGAEPFPLAAGGTPSSVTHVTSNATDFGSIRFSLSDGTYYVGRTNHAVATCQ
jgi:hypothetical protein